MAKTKKPKQKIKNGGVKGLNSLNAIPPEQIELLQVGVFNVVKQNMPRVREVLTGTRQWNPQQVKLYLALLDKVMPTLSQSHNEHFVRKDLNELTQDELRALVAEEMAKRQAIEHMPTDDPLIPIEAQVATLMTSPLFPEEQ